MATRLIMKQLEAGLADHACWQSARAGLLRKNMGAIFLAAAGPDRACYEAGSAFWSDGYREVWVSTEAALDLIEAVGLRGTTGGGGAERGEFYKLRTSQSIAPSPSASGFEFVSSISCGTDSTRRCISQNRRLANVSA